MIKFTIKNLEIFLEVVEQASFSLAAEALGMTQSSVSIAINALEKSIGTQLLERNGRKKIELTSAGEMLYPAIKQLVEKSNDIQVVFRGNHESQPLLIGGTRIVIHEIFPELGEEFTERYPGYKFILEPGSSEKVHQLLKEDAIRIGFTYSKKDVKSYTYVPLFYNQYVIVTAASDRYRAMLKSGATGEDLIHEPIVIGRDWMLAKYVNYLGIPYDDLHIVVRVKDPATEKEMVMRGIGVSLLPKLAIRNEVQEGKMLAFNLNRPGMERLYYMVYRNDIKLTEAERSFIAFVKNKYQDQEVHV